MHTYTKAMLPDGKTTGFQVGYATTGPTAEHTVSPLGPVFETEPEAAAFTSFLNGGNGYSPGAMKDALPPPPPDPEIEAEKVREERRAANKAAGKRPEGLEDYPHEDDRPAHPGAAPKPKQQPAHPAKRKHEVKRSKGKKR